MYNLSKRWTMNKANQTTRPRINKIGPTQKEPRKVRLYFKSGNSTMLLVKNIEYEVAILLESRLKRFLRERNSKLEGTFITTQ